MFFISQLGKQDCAFACLKMMLANYHQDKNYLYLPCEMNKSYSFQEIITIARGYNLELNGVKISSASELFKCESFPIVVTLNRRRGEKHSVLVLKANHRNVTIFDPELGKRKMNTELFFKEWNLRALLFAKVNKTKCPTQFPDFIAKKDKIILPILQVLSGISLLLGTYFISDKVQFYLPIIFFSLFVVFELLFRNALVNSMKRMDELILDYPIAIDKTTYPEFYKTVEKYRLISLTVIPNFIYSCMIMIFISFILVMNDLVNIAYIILPLALAVVEVFIYNPFFKGKEIELVEKEKGIDDIENDFQFKMKSNEIHDSAYKFALNKNIFNYVEIAIMVFTIALTMALTGVINITYVIFYLCISIFLKGTFGKILEYSFKTDEYDYARAKLINSIQLVDKNS